MLHNFNTEIKLIFCHIKTYDASYCVNYITFFLLLFSANHKYSTYIQNGFSPKQGIANIEKKNEIFSDYSNLFL